MQNITTTKFTVTEVDENGQFKESVIEGAQFVGIYKGLLMFAKEVTGEFRKTALGINAAPVTVTNYFVPMKDVETVVFHQGEGDLGDMTWEAVATAEDNELVPIREW